VISILSIYARSHRTERISSEGKRRLKRLEEKREWEVERYVKQNTRTSDVAISRQLWGQAMVNRQPMGRRKTDRVFMFGIYKFIYGFIPILRSKQLVEALRYNSESRGFNS
jgi:hypothetical protein